MEEVYKQMRRYETPNPPVHHLKGSLKTLQYLMNKLLHQKKAGSKHRYRYPDLSMIEDDPLKLAEISMRDKQQLMEEAELDLFRTHVSKIIENIYHKLSKLSKEDSITKSTKKIFQDTTGESASKKASIVSQDKSETEKASKDFIKTTLKASKAAKRKLGIEPSQKDFDISEKIAKISGVIEEESRTKTETKTPKATNEKSITKKDLKVKTVPGTFEDIKERPRKSANTRPTFFPLRTETKDYILLPESENDKKKLDLRSGKEFVLTLRIYLPFHYKRPSYKQTRMSKFQNEIQVLGSTTLLELREVLFCIEDFRSLDGDVSENPLEPSGRRYKDRYPSSMFFINNTFYVDYSKNVDYSIVLKEWAKTQNIPLNFKTEDMGKTRIIDLQIKFNYMYLFQHLGECEHLIEFIGNKLIDGGRHSLCSTDYPKFTKMLKYQGHLCLLCNKAFPSWMVVGYSRLPNKYSLLCKVCFKSYCYIDDKKIGSFKAYHHIDSRALVTY